MERKLTYPEKILRKDIKYRGPLSFRGLRIIGWIAFSFAFCTIALSWGIKLMSAFGHEESAASFETVADVFSYFAVLPVPLFLIANLGIIAKGRTDYKKLIKKFVILASAIVLIFYLFFLRYVLVFAIHYSTEDVSAWELIESINNILVSRKGAFNVFIDLLLCTLMCYFLFYKPKEKFQGKKLIYFRLLVLIPIFYEIGMVTLKELNNYVINLPIFFLPFFPTKPPLLILLFLGVIFFMKFRENRVVKKGMSVSDYHQYLKTNGHSLMFSVSICVGLLIVSVIDIINILLLFNVPSLTIEFIFFLKIIGTGNTAAVFLAIPIIMLYSYTKEPKKNEKLDLLIPVGGIGLCALALFEGIFAILMAIG